MEPIIPWPKRRASSTFQPKKTWFLISKTRVLANSAERLVAFDLLKVQRFVSAFGLGTTAVRINDLISWELSFGKIRATFPSCDYAVAMVVVLLGSGLGLGLGFPGKIVGDQWHWGLIEVRQWFPVNWSIFFLTLIQWQWIRCRDWD